MSIDEAIEILERERSEALVRATSIANKNRLEAAKQFRIYTALDLAALTLSNAAEREAGTYQPCRDADRSEFEAAIAEIELDIKPLHPCAAKHLDLAITVLREKMNTEGADE